MAAAFFLRRLLLLARWIQKRPNMNVIHFGICVRGFYCCECIYVSVCLAFYFTSFMRVSVCVLAIFTQRQNDDCLLLTFLYAPIRRMGIRLSSTCAKCSSATHNGMSEEFFAHPSSYFLFLFCLPVPYVCCASGGDGYKTRTDIGRNTSFRVITLLCNIDV